MSNLTREQIIEAFRQDGRLAWEVLLSLNVGFWDEWDCDVLSGVLVHGFGGPELQIAAKATPDRLAFDDPDTTRTIEDSDNHYRLWIDVLTKNVGPVKDLNRAEVLSILRENIESRLKTLSKAHWVLQLETKPCGERT